MTIADAAMHLECSPAKISRIETGAVGVRIQDLRDLVELYRVSTGEQDELFAQVRSARRKGWWHEFADVLPPNSETFFGLEDAAATIKQHSPSLIPGLFQTRSYAWALIRSSDDTSEVCERRLELRMRRQRLLERLDAPRMEVLLDEAALYRQIGGPEVMAEQLSSLLSWFESPNVDIRVIPLSAGAHAAVGVAFTIFTFSDRPEDAPLIYNEQLTHNAYFDETTEVGVFLSAWRGASEVALPVERSHDLISRCLSRLREGATASSGLIPEKDRLPTPRGRASRPRSVAAAFLPADPTG
jgi:hypothetical protein